MISHKLGWVRWYLDVEQDLVIIDNDTFDPAVFIRTKQLLLTHLQLEEQSNIQNNIYNAQKHLYYKIL